MRSARMLAFAIITLARRCAAVQHGGSAAFRSTPVLLPDSNAFTRCHIRIPAQWCSQYKLPARASLKATWEMQLGTSHKRHPKVLFVLGGPGAGKGTQSNQLMTEFGWAHLSAGDLLRREREQGTADGKLIDEYIREGKIVPVEISLGLIRKAMSTHPVQMFVVDGFPRNLDNLEGWRKYMHDTADVANAVFIDCPQIELEKRLLERGRTSGRTDDNADSARKRFATYTESTLPIVEYFEEHDQLIRVSGLGEPEHVFERIKRAVLPLLAEELIEETRALLAAISEGDYNTYKDKCAESLTCFEAESNGQLVEGLDFHKYYFDNKMTNGVKHVSTMSQPHVRVMNRAAVVSYVRVVQAQTTAGDLVSKTFAETRVWQLIHGRWKCVHFHRSACP